MNTKCAIFGLTVLIMSTVGFASDERCIPVPKNDDKEVNKKWAETIVPTLTRNQKIALATALVAGGVGLYMMSQATGSASIGDRLGAAYNALTESTWQTSGMGWFEKLKWHLQDAWSAWKYGQSTRGWD